MSGWGAGLLVVESPGSARRLTRLLRAMGCGWLVSATCGHVMRYPATLYPLGIDAAGNEWLRQPVASVARRLVALSNGRRVVLATDADAEGNVIARDVARIVRPVARSVERIELRAHTPNELRKALASASSFDECSAREADARRMVDRVLSHQYTQPGRPVGRVMTATLASCQRTEPVVGHVVLTMPAADGGQPWRAEVPVTPSTRALWAARLRECTRLPAAGSRGREGAPSERPWRYGDILIGGMSRGRVGGMP